MDDFFKDHFVVTIIGDKKKMEKPIVNLLGQDGNAFTVIGLCMKAARQAKWSAEKITQIQNEMMASDYDNLLATAYKYFEVR